MAGYLVTGLLTGAAYALFAVGFVLVFKGTKVFNLAQGEIGGAGLYLAWWLLPHMPVLAASLVGVAFAALLGVVLERLLVHRLRDGTPLGAVAVTLGFGLTIAYTEAKLFGFNVKTFPSPVGTGSIEVAGVVMTAPRLAGLAVAVAVAIGITVFLRRTRAGLAMRATTSDASLARLSGVEVDHARAGAWAAGSALAAVAAILLASTYTFHPFSNTLLLVPALAAVLLAGLTSLSGALVGGIALGVFEALVISRVSTPGVVDAAIFALILTTVLVRPEGIFRGAQ